MNLKTIHRTNFLLGWPYGTEFTYDEMVVAGDGDRGKKAADEAAGATAAILKLAASATVQPGEGPPREALDLYPYKLLFIGTLPNGKRIDLLVTGDMDFALGSTSKMLAEAGVCLAKDVDSDGGFWTPASLMGYELGKRLIDNAGLTFDFVEA